ncbi:MAG: peptide chain release factor N(5)-glutamine methyltransferase [Lachnospiraceae bacterium]|nr:peptide chain release factor N(5)-glutamine methyltransferase [Lachnospiraceae bacterium]
MTYSELVAAGVNELSAAGFEEARTDVRDLVFYVCGMDFTALLRDGGEKVPPEQEKRFFDLLTERKKHVPVQYLTGEQEFCGLKFSVRPGVLIPRPETELLAEAVFRASAGKRVLDMCTGSGCIAVTVAKLGTPSFVAASDYSAEALVIAKENAVLQGAEVTFFQGDLFETVEGMYDIIVSNPPYIKSEVVEELMSDVRDFEPRMALDGKADGLYFYRRICAEAKKYLNPGGRLMFEIGYDQGETVPELLRAEGYTGIEVKKDYAGLDRMVFAVWP